MQTSRTVSSLWLPGSAAVCRMYKVYVTYYSQLDRAKNLLTYEYKNCTWCTINEEAWWKKSKEWMEQSNFVHH